MLCWNAFEQALKTAHEFKRSMENKQYFPRSKNSALLKLVIRRVEDRHPVDGASQNGKI